MHTVYLDQNHWIELAKAYHGRSTAPGTKNALEFIRETSLEGTHTYPLSAVHYMETNRVRGAERRGRLGAAMWALSQGRTISLGRSLLVYEIERALSKRFPGVEVSAFSLLGRGVAFAFDQPPVDLGAPRVPSELRLGGPCDATPLDVHAAFERSLLTGEGPGGEMPASVPGRDHARGFMTHLATLPSSLASMPRDQWDRVLYAIVLNDILEPLTYVLGRNRMTLQDVLSLGQEGVGTLIDDLPSRRVDVHLHRQVLKNPAVTPKLTDLEDWAALGPASAHCDTVVCERHFASLLLRDGFRPRARVLTNLARLC